MPRCFTCNNRIAGEPDFIRGQFGEEGSIITLPVCSRQCVEQCEWANPPETGE